MRADHRKDATGRGTLTPPEPQRSPWWELGRRLLLAVAILVGTVVLVYFDRHGYVDNNDPTRRVGLIDAIYYTTVTLSTTGYGDITPASDSARLVNAFIITPARIGFLVLLIGTTLEVLASQGREMFRVALFRRNMRDHVVVIGYGTKGRSAAQTLMGNGRTPEEIVVVDSTRNGQQSARFDKLAVVPGDATRREVLREAEVDQARQVIITTDLDATNVLVTLTVRQLNPDAFIVTAVREQENVSLMKQSGANSVVTSADAVGRLLGLSSLSPTLGSVMEDLMTYGEGPRSRNRDLLVREVGKRRRRCPTRSSPWCATRRSTTTSTRWCPSWRAATGWSSYDPRRNCPGLPAPAPTVRTPRPRTPERACTKAHMPRGTILRRRSRGRRAVVAQLAVKGLRA